MIQSKSRKRKINSTPWDAPAYEGEPCGAPSPAKPSVPTNLGICLHGMYFFDPATCTSEEVRQFLWAGIRVLDKEVKAHGLSEKEVRRILTGTFDVFHDTANVLWASLQQMKAKRLPAPAQARSTAALVQPATESAGEEDYPIASFYKPATYEWTSEGYEARESLRRFSEQTHANR
jgi:hypothetical protein